MKKVKKLKNIYNLQKHVLNMEKNFLLLAGVYKSLLLQLAESVG